MLDGATPIRLRDGEIVSVGEFKKNFLEYADLISFLFDLENKLMTITMTEYWRQPATLIDALRIYSGVRREMKREDEQ
jgi:hypothetical protein